MWSLLLRVSLIAFVAGCSGAPPTLGGPKFRYGDFEVDTRTNAIRRTGAEPHRLQNEPHVRFDRFYVLDAGGRRTDYVWIDDGHVCDWNQFKLLADTATGGIVLHQRFQPLFPGGNPWDEFLIDNSKGETGSHLDALPEGLSREQVHVVYVFGSAGLMAASYDSNGQLIRIFARHDDGATAGYPTPNTFYPFAAYDMPTQIADPIVEPPLNDALRHGLDKISSSTYP